MIGSSVPPWRKLVESIDNPLPSCESNVISSINQRTNETPSFGFYPEAQQNGEPNVTLNNSSTASSSILLIDSFLLLREIYILSLQSPRFNDIDLKQYSWLIGEDFKVDCVPLLDFIDVIRQGNQIIIHFLESNIAVDPSSPTQWKDKYGERFTIGDLVLSAFQIQAEAIKTQHILDLDLVPLSYMDRQDLAKALQDPNILPSNNTLQNYDAEVLTQIKPIDISKPILIGEEKALEQIFKMSVDQAKQQNVLIGGIAKADTSMIAKVGSKHHLPELKGRVALLSIQRFQTDIDTETEMARVSNVRSTFPRTVEEGIRQVQCDLVGTKGILRVNRSLGSQLIQLFDQYLQAQPTEEKKWKTTQETQTSKKSLQFKQSSQLDSHQPKKPLLERTRNTAMSVVGRSSLKIASTSSAKHSTHRVHPYSGNTQKIPRTLWEILSSRKQKPIIVVPSALSSYFVNLSNFKYFLENKELPELRSSSLPLGLGTTYNATNSGEGNFVWTVNIPIPRASRSNINSSNGPQSNSRQAAERLVDFKIVGDSQVTKFRVEDWHRIVAVVVQGPDWQFQYWPFNNYANLFNCIRGVHLAFDSESLPPLVEKYPIQVLRLRRTQRHCDVSAWTQFVQGLGSILDAPRNFSHFDKIKIKSTRS